MSSPPEELEYSLFDDMVVQALERGDSGKGIDVE